ncbi:hypothetical protein D3C75_754500 [compost metagenome]
MGGGYLLCRLILTAENWNKRRSSAEMLLIPDLRGRKIHISGESIGNERLDFKRPRLLQGEDSPHGSKDNNASDGPPYQTRSKPRLVSSPFIHPVPTLLLPHDLRIGFGMRGKIMSSALSPFLESCCLFRQCIQRRHSRRLRSVVQLQQAADTFFAAAFNIRFLFHVDPSGGLVLLLFYEGLQPL